MATLSILLNLKDALRLYDLLGSHIPKDVDENETINDFIGKIIHSIVVANEHRCLIDAIMLMSGKSQEEVLSLSPGEMVLTFSDGLVKNHILLLCSFCEEIGYGRTRKR